MRLDVYVHFTPSDDHHHERQIDWTPLFEKVLTQLGALRVVVERQGAQLMTRFSDVQSLLDAMNSVTNDLSAKVNVVVTNEAAQLALIQSLKDQIAQGSPVSQEQLDALAADLQGRTRTLEAIRDHLASVATNPEAPAGSGSEGLPTEPAAPGVPPSDGAGATGGDGTGSQGGNTP